MVKYGGTPVSPGIALGLVYVYRPFRARVEKALCKKEDRDREESRYLRAMEQARAELSRIIASFPSQKAGKAKIFTAHREILEDEEIIDLILEGIQGLQSAEYAVFEAYGEFIGLVSKAGDEGIASRSIDFQDVRDRLLRILSGMPEKSLSSLPRPVVVVAHELLPSETATLDREKVLGIIGETGGVTSHTAILASSYDIPDRKSVV